MDALQIVFGILLIIVSLGLIVVVMLQDSKQDGLSALSGQSSGISASRAKNLRYEAMLKKLTIVFASVFVVLALVLFGISNKTTATTNVPATSDITVTTDASVTEDQAPATTGDTETTKDAPAETGDASATEDSGENN